MPHTEQPPRCRSLLTCHDGGWREGLRRQAAAAVVAVVRRAAHARAAAARRAVRVVRRAVGCRPAIATIAAWAAVAAGPAAVVRWRPAAVPHLRPRSVRIVHARPSVVVAHRWAVRQRARAGRHGVARHSPLDLNLPSSVAGGGQVEKVSASQGWPGWVCGGRASHLELDETEKVLWP